MKIEYDPKHDLLNIEFIPDATIVDSMEIDGIIIDYSEEKISLQSKSLTLENEL